jgi:hypothetical protein
MNKIILEKEEIPIIEQPAKQEEEEFQAEKENKKDEDGKVES